ncbi:MAG: hypothetical protein GY853_16000 [PVC group bacterium]|nr:hypothetical protein [PVC group bacterium]
MKIKTITIDMGEEEDVVLTIDEARELKDTLNELFKEPAYAPLDVRVYK